MPEGLRVDFTGVESGGFPVMPSGWYTVKVTDYEIKQSGPNAKNPGSDYINWEFTIQDGEFENRKQWAITSLLPQALFGLKGLLAAAGWTEEQLSGPIDLDPIFEEIIGRELQVKVIQEKYEDEMRNKTKGFRAVGSGAADDSDKSLLP